MPNVALFFIQPNLTLPLPSHRSISSPCITYTGKKQGVGVICSKYNKHEKRILFKVTSTLGNCCSSLLKGIGATKHGCVSSGYIEIG